MRSSDNHDGSSNADYTTRLCCAGVRDCLHQDWYLSALRTLYGRGTRVGDALSDGAKITVVCETEGQFVESDATTNNIWERLDNGAFIPNSFTLTGYNSWTPGMPRCDEQAPEPAPEPETTSTIVSGIDVGSPQNERHKWGSCTVQDFDGGPYGRLIVDYTHGTNIVRHGMLEGWIAEGGAPKFGCPRGEEHSLKISLGSSLQDFDGGTLYWVNGMSRAKKAVPIVAFKMRWSKLDLTYSYEGNKLYEGNVWQAVKNWNDAIPELHITPAAPGQAGDITFKDVWDPDGEFAGRVDVPSSWSEVAAVDEDFHEPAHIDIHLNEDKMMGYDDFKRTFTTTHELGHALGLAHPDNVVKAMGESSIMRQNTSDGYNSFAQGFNTPRKFDILSIKQLYGLPI